MNDSYTEPFVRARLEDAGRTLMMLPSSGLWPMGYASTWPEVKREWQDMIGCNLDNTPAKIRPTMQQMNDLEEVLGWLVNLGKYCRRKDSIRIAKAVGYGMLRRPDTDRRVFSWEAIADMLKTNRKYAKNWYKDGILITTRILNQNSEVIHAPRLYRKGNQG